VSRIITRHRNARRSCTLKLISANDSFSEKDNDVVTELPEMGLLSDIEGTAPYGESWS
jgi:hypothetical protein